MNKLIKGAVTGAAGIALLLGGAGTFAAWNAGTSISDKAVVSNGHLTVAVDSKSATWTDADGTIDPSTYVFAPGDTITLVEDVTITAQGHGLTAKLSAIAPAAAATAGYDIQATFGTAAHLTDNGDHTYTIDAGDTDETIKVPVTVVISLPKAADNTTMNAQFELKDLAISLEELTPAAYAAN
jgi:alternate signal-mediated exported protein